jgi:hypothetical protein
MSKQRTAADRLAEAQRAVNALGFESSAAIRQAIKEADAAFAAADYGQAEHLVAVVLAMARRERKKIDAPKVAARSK